MSLVSVLSDDDDDKTGTTLGTTVDSRTAHPVPTCIQGWPTLSSGSVAETPSSATTYSALDQTILNDLASSRAEVEALKIQVSQLVAQHELQAQQIAEAVHAQVTRALATQQVNQPTSQPTVTQDQLSAFLNMQETKFDIMANMFREMTHKTIQPFPSESAEITTENRQENQPNPPPFEQAGTTATKRTATVDLELVLDSEESMEIDSQTTSSSRKRNDQR